MTIVVAGITGSAPVRPPPDAGQSLPGRPLAAVSPVGPSAERGETSRADAVAALLRQRADAIRQRDEEAFLATVDPQATREFVRAQRALFANLAEVPLAEWSYLTHPEDTVSTARLPSDGASELWAPRVDLQYALSGADSVPTTRPMGYLFARYDTGWYLRSDTALDVLGRRTWRGPWDFAPCVVRASQHGLVIAHPGNEPMVERLIREVDAAVPAVTAVWGTGWTRRVALVLPDSLAEMRALAGQDYPVESVVAVALADRVDRARRTVAGQRVVLSPTSATRLSVASLRVVLRHEILHVAARADTVDGSPMWLLEGFADYVGYRDSGISLARGAPGLVDLVRRDGPPRWLPQDRDFLARGDELELAYQKSWSVARFVAERYGEATLVRLYRTLASAGSASAGETDRMLRSVLGLDRAGLVEEWRRYLGRAIG